MTAYATIKYVPQCECPLNGLVQTTMFIFTQGDIVCATCWKLYKPEIVYHNVVAKQEEKCPT